MKKPYVKPVMECEEFVPAEYVAACYSIECRWKASGCNEVYTFRYMENGSTGIGTYMGNSTFTFTTANKCKLGHMNVTGYAWEWLPDGKTNFNAAPAIEVRTHSHMSEVPPQYIGNYS